MHTNMQTLHSLLSKIGDDGDSKADDGEYGTNVGHPSKGKGYGRRGSFWWASRTEVLRGNDTHVKLRDITEHTYRAN